ncbi:hypothetical protein TVAG_407210 [Trichomonas vaginalis G3]|uniref:Uncharacterized protein n=1 Tax=Trichomonas vaginalis (strain ATCC PRA-98 / G3) TaxID=412133 RepID=A2F418_TRIV3|nr:hypothetical protein TVAGG3_0227330 [Trichomonas vaginalis G3]EAY00372.1 hypothetical protein TVAG_407210 [Trichomonas vaginalis G3]KAI5552357.1 hypothetical protein TVAGG3_0227330 [Trichomonas vaginalis G3]|eukprot:XP_001313301.1 hypothetical protein [Trichomonas vaginalis G3]
MHKTSQGGSLYINLKKGECIQNRICSFGSRTLRQGVYCYVTVSSASPFKNYIFDSTITSSGYENEEGDSNIYLFNGEINLKSINISYSKLIFTNFYSLTPNSNSNITFSTFSNNWSPSNNYEAIHSGSFSASPEFTMLFCNFFENHCTSLILSYFKLYVINCSIYSNSIEMGIFEAGNDQIEVKGCYVQIYEPNNQIIGDVIITETVNEAYPQNLHFTSSCSTELKLPEEETKEKEEIKVDFKRKNKFNIFLFFVSLNSE